MREERNLELTCDETYEYYEIECPFCGERIRCRRNIVGGEEREWIILQDCPHLVDVDERRKIAVFECSPERRVFACACSDPRCNHKLSLLFGCELLHVAIEGENSTLTIFIDRDSAKQIAQLINEWVG